MDPLWAELEALLGSRPVFSPTHPWGCHRRRIPDRVVFEHIVQAMVHGSGYEIIASRGCSDRTIRRRVTEWAGRGLGQKLHEITLAAYDKIIGLELDDLATDGCITKAPCGGEKAGLPGRPPQRRTETLGLYRRQRRPRGDRLGR